MKHLEVTRKVVSLRDCRQDVSLQWTASFFLAAWMSRVRRFSAVFYKCYLFAIAGEIILVFFLVMSGRA